MRTAVKQAILSMRKRYYEPITLQEIAAEVFVSPFHLSRIFARDTGVTPGRYLTSIRLFEAKRMLLNTSLTVSDIVCSVGYSSVGTFTTRFTQAVGMTPTQYRAPEVGKLLVAAASEYHHLPSLDELRRAGRTCVSVRPAMGGSIVGSIDVPDEIKPADILIGVFDNRIPQRGPTAFTALPRSGSSDLAINNVPEGEWWVIAVAEPAAAESHSPQICMGTLQQSVSVAAGRVSRISLRMREVEPTDPPIAITLAAAPTAGSQRALGAQRAALRAAA